MKQSTLASFNFKKSSNDPDGQSLSNLHRKKILTHVCRRSPTSVAPPPKKKKKKRKAFPSSWLSQFDLLGFDEKRGTIHLMFHFNETID